MRYGPKLSNKLEGEKLSMDCVQIAHVGLGIRWEKNCFPIGKYLQKFSITIEEFRSLSDSVYIVVQEQEITCPDKRTVLRNYSKWEETGQTILAVPYGHCQNAVCFSPEEWRSRQITVWINPLLRKEMAFTLNQFLSLTGLHSPLLDRGALTVHASYISTDIAESRGAILFTGPSGMGKSTQADLWNRYTGAEIINGDRVVIKRENSVLAKGKTDNCNGDFGWSAHGIPVCGSSNICKNISLPVGMIVVLKQGSENHVEEMTAGEKYRALLLASAFYQWDAYESEEAHRLVLKLIEEVPIVRLVCRPDEGAVHILKEYIEKKCRK